MAESKHHLVIDVLIFLKTPEAQEIPLTANAVSVLIFLASHEGGRGIFPSIRTLSKYIRKHKSSVKRAIYLLKKLGFLEIVNRNGRVSHYHIKLSTTELTHEPGTPKSYPQPSSPMNPTGLTGEPGVGSPMSPDIVNRNNKNKSERKKRAPLPENFFPESSITRTLLEETANRAGKPVIQLLQKFSNLCRSKQKLSASWDAELENFLLNERPVEWANALAKSSITPDTRCAVPEWGPGHPSWEALHGKH